MSSAATRQEQLDAVGRHERISVLIVGGGINGAGLFRELALQGVDVVLVEQSDFGSGAGVAATRTIPGGLRQIETGDWRLVRESLRERNRLLANAPHSVKPLAITIPIFHPGSGRPNALGAFLGSTTNTGGLGTMAVKIGLTLFDLLKPWSRALPRHRFHGKRRTAELHPGLAPGTLGTATFYDATVTFAERLCLELALDAERCSTRAIPLNYVGLEGAEGETVRLRDEQTGRLYSIKPRIVVNATGAWLDITGGPPGRAPRFNGGTTGSYVVLDHPELLAAAGGGMIYFANDDGRNCIVYPFRGRVLASAEGMPVTDAGAAVGDGAEVGYILDSIRQILPKIRLDRSHVSFQFRAVRPPPRSGAASRERDTADDRDPVVPTGEGLQFPVYSLATGRWTAFRALAERVADRLLEELGRSRHGSSRKRGIGGGKGYPRGREEREEWLEGLRHLTGLPRERVQVLFERYGTGARRMGEYLCRRPDRNLEQVSGYSRREIEFLVAREKVVHLDDLVLRRTHLGLLGQADGPALTELAAVLGGALGWREQRRVEEVERTVERLTAVQEVDEEERIP